MIRLRQCLYPGLLLMAGSLAARAGTFSANFNSGDLPPNTATNFNAAGGAYLETTGGTGNSGVLKLTKNINGQNGSFIIDDIDAGQPIYGFDITFKLRIGGGSGTPADGFSISFGPDVQMNSLFGEGGAGSGIRFGWDIYNNPDTPPAPQINVRVGGAGTMVATKNYTIAGITTTGSDPSTWFADVHIRMDPDGSLDLDYKGANVFTNFFIPGYQSFVDAGLPGRFGLGARTGGLNANQWVDDLQITTFTTPLVGISQAPYSQTVQQGDNAYFDVRVANTNGVTYQWRSNNVALAGANTQSLMLTNVQPGASGSIFTVVATGPNNVVTSAPVTLTVVNLTLPPAQLAFDFNDGLLPAQTAVFGTAFADTTGGYTNSGGVKLVNPSGSGILTIPDQNAGANVYGFTARFKIYVGGGTVPPADGFAVAFGSDLPADPSTANPNRFEEGEGLGTGLRVTFDIYNNDGIFGYTNVETVLAPSIDVRYGNQVLGSVRLPFSFVETGNNPDDASPIYDDVIIQLNNDGTVTVVYRGAVIFNRLPVPAFSFVSGGTFAIGARTGSLNDNIWVDDLQFSTTTTPGGLRLTTQPTAQTVLVNHAATFTVGVSDTNNVTYQWIRSGTNITGATGSAFTLTPALLSDSGSLIKVQVTKGINQTNSNEALLTVVDLAPPTSPNLTFNFNDNQVPAGTAVYSGAGGGYIADGVLHITDAVNGQSGAFVISNLYNGAQVSAIAVSYDVRMGGGSGNPADGFSFNFAPNLPDATSGGENGVGNGLSISFDIYGGLGDNPPAPNLNIRYKGALVASTQVPKPELETGDNFRTLLLRVDQDGKLYLSYGERVFYNGLQLPNYTFTAAGKFGFYGRTGGENENQWIDNIQIKATQSSGPLTITEQPANVLVLAGATATFRVGLSDPNGATYQWFRNNVQVGTTASYTTPATVTGDNGAVFRVQATGPSGSVTSSNAVLTVVAPITIGTPIINFTFDDCATPENTILNGNAGGGYIACTGGVGDSGVLHLTDNVNGQGGTLIIPDRNTNAPIKAFTAYFAVRVADGSAVPADGFSFIWAPSNSIPDNAVFGQGGIGDGLIVSFDTYNNSGEAPSFSIFYHGNLIATQLVPLSTLMTTNLSEDPLLQYADVYIRVNDTGTVDVQYKGLVAFSGVQLPGYAPLAGGEFALGGATGGQNASQWVDNLKIATTTGLNAVPLGFSQVGNELRLTWGSGFKLQSTPSLTTPIVWTDVNGATSPYTVNTSTGNGLFYRLASVP